MEAVSSWGYLARIRIVGTAVGVKFSPKDHVRRVEPGRVD